MGTSKKTYHLIYLNHGVYYPAVISIFTDVTHTGDLIITRRSQARIVMFINNAPIFWYSKRQATIEASTFSFEFVVL